MIWCSTNISYFYHQCCKQLLNVFVETWYIFFHNRKLKIILKQIVCNNEDAFILNIRITFFKKNTDLKHFNF